MASLDPQQIREQVNQARRDLGILETQAKAIEGRMVALRGYIRASEQMLQVIPGATLPLLSVTRGLPFPPLPRRTQISQTPELPSKEVIEAKDRSIRALVSQVLVAHPGRPYGVQEILSEIERLGANIKAKNKVEAVHFALIDLRKRDDRFRRVGERLWQYDNA